MATCWAKCSDLFLYTKGNDVYLWRWNKTTWMPMKTADFEDLGKVTDYVDLIGGKDSMLEWEKSAYIDLVAYISSRRLLVNSKGLVIAELGFHGQDGEMEKNERPFYVRLLDVLSLKQFGLRDRTVPSRTARYLETKGRVAPVEGSTITTTSRETEKQVAELKAANKTLKSDNEALKSDKEAAETKAAMAVKEATELKKTNKTLRNGKEASDKQVKDLQDQIIKSLPKKPDWMSDPYFPGDNNMGFTKLSGLGIRYLELTLVGSQGSITTEDDTTNVRASYMYKFTSIVSNQFFTLSGVDIASLPEQEMARFTNGIWYRSDYKGSLYVTKETNRSTIVN